MNVFWKRAATAAMTATLLIACVGCGSAPVETAEPTTTAPSTTVVTTTTQNAAMNSEVNVRSGPGFEYEVLGGVPAMQPIVIVGREGDWYKIEHGDGYGYVNAHFVDVDGAPNASQMAASRVTAPPTTTMGTTKPGDRTTTAPAGGTTTVAGGTTAVGATTTTASTAATLPTSTGGIPDTQANDAF